MTEKEVYSFYNEKVKILYSEIEARENTLPVVGNAKCNRYHFFIVSL
jgi:hypothetical protein